MFILISIIGLLIYGRYLSANNGWENIISYYKDLISGLKGNNSTYVVAEKAAIKDSFNFI